MGNCTFEESTRVQINEALEMARLAKCTLMIGGEIITLAVAAARLGQEEIRRRSEDGLDAEGLHKVATNVGRLFHNCRLVQITLPDVAIGADGLLQAFCGAVEGTDVDIYQASRRDVRSIIGRVSQRISELADSIRDVCALLDPPTETRRHIVFGINNAANSLRHIASCMGQAL